MLVYCTGLFLGSMLLFAIEPMFSKMILPLLGGTPAVWNTAMMFFQAMLLAGYLYAHLLSRLKTLRRQVLLHTGVLAAGLPFLPIHLAWQDTTFANTHPVLWLIGLFTVSIGLPFFAVSATAPLLQRWFSRSDHPRAVDPYFLYASSNTGGLIALLTREAMALYMQKLAPSGIALLHISNRYLKLEPVVANLAEDADLAALIQEHEPNDDQVQAGGSASTWVAVGRSDSDLASLDPSDGWRSPELDPAVGVWTDDYSNIVRTLLWGKLFHAN